MTNQEKIALAFKLTQEVFLEVEKKPDCSQYLYESLDKVLDDLDYIKREV